MNPRSWHLPLPLLSILTVLFLAASPGCDSGSTTGNDPIVNPIDTTGNQNDTLTSDTGTTDTTGFGRFDGDTADGGKCIWVEPYHRTDGTCVRGHWKSAPGKDCSRVGIVLKDCP